MVARRTNEIGIRMALGAAPRQILAMVLSEAGRLLAIGVAVGVVLTVAAGRWAASLLFGLKPYDPKTLAAAVVDGIGSRCSERSAGAASGEPGSDGGAEG